jgi:anaerobic ribonucleoside-triphosphate reductase activating protein
MKIAINKAHFPVTVLGPGRRIGIWLQGCSIACKGCISQDTWAADPGRLMALPELLNWCRSVSGGQLDGITLSGGEPFDQPQALAALLNGLLAWRKQAQLDFDILCYSGYPYAKLQRLHPRLLEKLDALIPEPYVAQLANQTTDPQTGPTDSTQRWRGSANQPLILLSERARQRYTPLLAQEEGRAKRIQMMQDGQKIWYVGIPAKGDMAALEAACQAQGVVFSQVSWRS